MVNNSPQYEHAWRLFEKEILRPDSDPLSTAKWAMIMAELFEEAWKQRSKICFLCREEETKL